MFVFNAFRTRMILGEPTVSDEIQTSVRLAQASRTRPYRNADSALLTTESIVAFIV